MLHTFALSFLRGRPLDILDESELIEGETNEIFVSRLNIYEDAMDEVLCGTDPDYSIPLQVTFTGECAQDMGGPRKEFLGAIMREIKSRLFEEMSGETTFVLRDDVVAVDRMHFFGAGIIFGKKHNRKIIANKKLRCICACNKLEKKIKSLNFLIRTAVTKQTGKRILSIC